jgi:hypothetical protein
MSRLVLREVHWSEKNFSFRIITSIRVIARVTRVATNSELKENELEKLRIGTNLMTC